MYLVVEGNFTNSAPAVSVNDCTGSHLSNFEPSHIVQTGNEKSSSIACSDAQLCCTWGQNSLMGSIPVSIEGSVS